MGDNGAADLARSGGAEGPLTSVGPDQSTGGDLVGGCGHGAGGAMVGGCGHGLGGATAFGRGTGRREASRVGRSDLGPLIIEMGSRSAPEMNNS